MPGKKQSLNGIREIARLAGVSTATVSRVLNSPSQVKVATRDKVMAAVNETGYRPNAAAKALATKRTRTIAAVIPTLRHSIFAIFMNSLEDKLASLGFNLVIATHGFDASNEYQRCSDVLKMGAEALIVSGTQHDESFYQLLETTGIPCVCTSIYQADFSLPTIGYDNQLLAFRAIDYIVSQGHKRITVIHSDVQNNDRMSLRVQGVLSAAKELKDIDITLFQAELGVAGGVAVAKNLFAQKPLPDACLCLADVFALGLLFEAQRQKIPVPEELSVMGFEDTDWAAACEPPLTTVALPARQLAIETAESLVGLLDDSEPLTHKLLHGEIVKRKSL